MKRFPLFLLTFMMLLSLCACGKGDVYDVYLDEGTFTVDRVNETITHEGVSYQYDLWKLADGVKIDLTYPDGSTYSWTRMKNMGHGGGSSDYDENRYVDADTLLDVLEEEMTALQKGAQSTKFVGLGLISLPIGLFCCFAPQSRLVAGTRLVDQRWRTHGLCAGCYKDQRRRCHFDRPVLFALSDFYIT